jgi:hypothetical protein
VFGVLITDSMDAFFLPCFHDIIINLHMIRPRTSKLIVCATHDGSSVISLSVLVYQMIHDHIGETLQYGPWVIEYPSI